MNEVFGDNFICNRGRVMDEMQKDQLQSQDESLHSNQGADAGQGEALAPSPAVSAGESIAGARCGYG